MKEEYYPDWVKHKLFVEKEIKTNPKVFEFEGLHFIPIGYLPKNYDLLKTNKYISSSMDFKITRYNGNYTHKDFYMACGNINVDIFNCLETGKQYIPGENELFEYFGKVIEKMRKKQVEDKER